MIINRVTTLLFVGALGTGTAAAYFTDNYIESKLVANRSLLENEYEKVKVVVPKADLRTGDLLNFDNLAVREVPKAFLHAEALTPNEVDAVIGYRLVHAVNSGEPILMSYVSKSRGAGFSNLIDPGKRALTFPVDMLSSMSGLLRPGDHIDLLATLRDGNKTITKALLQNVAVLATGTRVDEFSQLESGARYQSITLLVSETDAAKITHAREIGTLTVVLRAPGDGKKGSSRAISVNQLIGNDRATRGLARPVEIIVGGQG